jgi:6-phosphogluconolactonase
MSIDQLNIHVYKNGDTLAAELADQFRHVVNQAAKRMRPFNIALSGGSTPALFFQKLALFSRRKAIAWQNVQIFWGDERCVPPDHPDSNYGMAKKQLFDHIIIPEENIHRIRGEAAPKGEAQRYADEIIRIIPQNDRALSQFDWILLGLGADGHTASIFSGSDARVNVQEICVITAHPETGQKRISLTMPLINNAKRITFLVTGESKSAIVAQILTGKGSPETRPASLVRPVQGLLEWFLDQAAAKFILT